MLIVNDTVLYNEQFVKRTVLILCGFLLKYFKREISLTHYFILDASKREPSEGQRGLIPVRK